jgi:hypothetical protein
MKEGTMLNEVFDRLKAGLDAGLLPFSLPSFSFCMEKASRGNQVVVTHGGGEIGKFLC